MKQITADLHFHSPYSRAVSPKMTLKNLASWAKVKGIDLITTADFTHPVWFKNLKENLRPIRQGIYQLKTDPEVNFLITTEISLIYKSHKIHLLIWVPTLETAEKINCRFKQLNLNLKSDGRPIFGLTAPKLLELLFKINKDILVIPAHIWTPWFSLFGSKSGFKSIKACFRGFASQIYAVETGLSSDPEMNWQIKELNKRRILSFSDAHSLPNLGRELTVFNLPKDYTYKNILKAIKQPGQIAKTIEFYPEEGKYHFSGHRKCNVSQSPAQTKKQGQICPVCQKPLTLGVKHQVEKYREQTVTPKTKVIEGIKTYLHPQNKHPPFIKLIPLAEIIAEAKNVGKKTKTVNKIYELAIKDFNNELNVLTQVPIKKIETVLGEKIGEGIEKNRLGHINIVPGFDGQYGKVKIWQEPEEREVQKGLF